ncbi:(2Fe-2S) ferredoxin domain-containing protein [Legionella oakridgensis]|uniref:Ferredoxin n=2 Tax=Legionella oakridgensis TaxID=29423 RepID=W0BHN0_9GAMM|nr:(2Fe-2S) ferredoxin domain-containing protein [Legionella oakridgensis]AHE68221.1 ferredoxin [Legionella oakridgensis ATCC 33761 = DSM 21215]ETO92304.1 ferredoxin [Legionella oakridgensis RV-2-2007]KTD39584.1 ferredoxin 2Fe-2S protein [Legionella oakridgensis]STY21179.1 ferredoxin 2Fe-2S protein [Legionella longbeachae]
MSYYAKHIFICTNQKAPGKTCCANSGGEPFFDYLKKELKRLDLHGSGKIRVSKSGCLGRCDLGPCLVVYPEGIWYSYRSFSDLDEIIQHHLLHGQVVDRLLID